MSLTDPLKNPKILPNGTLEVENLRERSSDNLSYQLDIANDKFYLGKDLDANTECQYIPQNIDKVYKTTVTLSEEIKKETKVLALKALKLVELGVSQEKLAEIMMEAVKEAQLEFKNNS